MCDAASKPGRLAHCSRRNRSMYVELTEFHADMYFSMHWVKQVDSPLENEGPGLGTHLSKQCSLIFCTVAYRVSSLASQTGFRDWHGVDRRVSLIRTSISSLAFSRAYWVLTCLMTSALIDSEESMMAVV